jgi:hypothetical protein
MLDKRLGPVAVLGVVILALALGWGISKLIAEHRDPAPAAQATDTPTPAPTPCQPASPPYGSAPDGFKYEEADETTRRKTITALHLDDKSGRVDMRLVRRTGLTLGSIVGVPSKDPADYAATLVATAQSGGVNVTRGRGYALIPLDSGQQVAVGVRGCRAVLISSQDPNATKYLAEAIFSSG